VQPLEQSSVTQDGVDSLREMLLSFAGAANGLPADMAHNHDHYLYGVPKKTDG
jgi:hypothetical protein